MSPVDWPRSLLLLLIFFMFVNMINIFRTTPAKDRNLSSLPSASSIAGLYKNKLFFGMVILVAFGYALPQLGFLPASFALASLYIILLGEKRVQYAALYGAIMVIVLFVLFSIILGITMPRGVGVFRDFALFVENII